MRWVYERLKVWIGIHSDCFDMVYASGEGCDNFKLWVTTNVCWQRRACVWCATDSLCCPAGIFSKHGRSGTTERWTPNNGMDTTIVDMNDNPDPLRPVLCTLFQQWCEVGLQRSIARLYFYGISKYSLYRYAVSSVRVIFILLSVLQVLVRKEVYMTEQNWYWIILTWKSCA